MTVRLSSEYVGGAHVSSSERYDGEGEGEGPA
jgi:hypothetical protein